MRPLASLLLLSAAAIALFIGNLSVGLTNGTLALPGPGVGRLVVNGVSVTLVNITGGPSRASIYPLSHGNVLIIISNTSFELINATPEYSALLRAWTANVVLCVNGSGASPRGMWQGPTYVNLTEVPGLSSVFHESNASCGEELAFYGSTPEYQLLTYFTNTSWLSITVSGSGWYLDIIMGGAPGAAEGTASGLPPPMSISSGLTSQRARLETPYALLIISLLALALSLVAERGRG